MKKMIPQKEEVNVEEKTERKTAQGESPKGNAWEEEKMNELRRKMEEAGLFELTNDTED